MKSFRALQKFVGGEWVGGRPNLMLAQVQVFCPGPGQDLRGTGPGFDLGPGPELDNWQKMHLPSFKNHNSAPRSLIDLNSFPMARPLPGLGARH